MATITYANSNIARLPEWAQQYVSNVLDVLGIPRAVVTSTRRTPADQARIMYENYTLDDASSSSAYGRTAPAVIAAWRRASDAGLNKADTIAAIADAIVSSGFQSDHMKSDVVTLDLGPRSSGFSDAQIQSLIGYLRSRPDSEVRRNSSGTKQVFGPGEHDAAVHMALVPPAGTPAWPDYGSSTATSSDRDQDAGDDEDDGPGVGTALAAGGVAFALGYAYKRWGRR